MIRKQAMACTNGQTNVNMKGGGTMGSNMDQEYTKIQTNKKLNMAYGSMAQGSFGIQSKKQKKYRTKHIYIQRQILKNR